MFEHAERDETLPNHYHIPTQQIFTRTPTVSRQFTPLLTVIQMALLLAALQTHLLGTSFGPDTV